MKKKKPIILICILLIIFIVSIVAAILIIKNKQNSQNEIIIESVTTTKQQRILWNGFLSSNPYLSQISTIPYVQGTDMIKIALTSDNVEIEGIVTEEIEKNELLTLGDGYKKSRSNINEYLKNLLGKEDIAYNFVKTYAEEDNYLIIGEEYVYYTKIELPEKIYIAAKYKEENSNYEVQIYEYDVTEKNRESLMKILETGEITNKTEKSNTYTLTGQIVNNNIKITSKKN